MSGFDGASASEPFIAGRTLDEWQAFARRDDCLERMVPSDLRQLVGVIVAAEIRRLDMSHKATRDGYPSMIDWIREYRFRTKATLKDSRDAYLAGATMPVLSWKLVPAEPTAEMRRAFDDEDGATDTDFARAYSAMLAAAPTPPMVMGTLADATNTKSHVP